MSQKLKDKKKLIITEQDDEKFIKSPYVYGSSSVYNKKKLFFYPKAQSSIYKIPHMRLSPMSGIDVLSQSTNEINELNKIIIKKHKKVHFNLSNSLITKGACSIISESDVSFRSKSPYCSQSLYESVKPQNLVGFGNIIQSIAKRSTYSTLQISECSTLSQSDLGGTISDLNREYLNSLEIQQRFKNMKKLSLNSDFDDVSATIDSNNSLLQKNKQEELQINIFSPKLKNDKYILSHLNKKQLIKLSNNLYCSNKNVSLKKPIGDLHIDSNGILSGISMSNLSTDIDSKLINNNFFNKIDSIKTNKIDNIKTIKSSGITTQIYNSDYNFKENNIVLKEFLKNQNLNEKSITNLTTTILSTDECMGSNQNLYEEYILDYIYNNSELSSIISEKSKSLSSKLSKKKSLYNNKMLNLDSCGNKSSSISLSNISQNIKNSSKEIHFQKELFSQLIDDDNFDFMLLPSSIFLTNYCSEYDKAYTKRDLKPNLNRNYYSNKVINSLKEDFDKTIPPKQSLKTFFKGFDNKCKHFEDDVHERVENILFMLEKI